MSAPGKPRGRRYSREAQQEDRSEGQIRDRLAEVGWAVDRLGRDLGEDLLVQIHDDGRSTGLSFYVQLKSVRGAERRRRKREPEALRYPLEVKDLLHWEVQTTPVVLVIWDVEKRAGYWQMIPEIIKALDAQGQEWRVQKTVTVSVPIEQDTGDGGLRRLRWAAADRSRALVAAPSPIELKFPGTEEGKDSLRSYKEALDRGTRVVFQGASIPQVEMPPWYRRLYGDRGQVKRLEISFKPTDASLPVRIEARSVEGDAALPYVDLRVTRRGRKQTIMSNEQQGLPFVVEVSLIEDGDSTVNLRRTRFGRTVQEAREAAAFWVALTRPGSRIRVSAVENGQTLTETSAPAAPQGDTEQARIHLEILEKLAFIEPRIAAFGSVSLDRGIDHDDIVAIDLLYRVCRDGKLERVMDWSFEVPPDAPARRPGPGDDVDFQLDGARLTLLGMEVPLGRVKVRFEDRERFTGAVREAVARAKATGKPAEVLIERIRALEEFPDWPRPADRLYDVASAQAGYFTLAQAATTGFAAAEQVETEQRVERCGGGVFRLVQFPPSEHEDLVVLWLQTDQKGVFSHDTALALHHLSDILPSRRHLTVPPGWEPPPSARLDRGVSLHHAELSPSEIAWLSPIPLTKPLRTIRDCIEKGVSPDLIEQAIAEALQRGMITQAEAQRLGVARARSA